MARVCRVLVLREEWDDAQDKYGFSVPRMLENYRDKLNSGDPINRSDYKVMELRCTDKVPADIEAQIIEAFHVRGEKPE